MLLTNHVLTGSLLGLAIDEPWLLFPAGVASHFILDSLPHYGDPKIIELSDKRFLWLGTADGLVAITVAVSVCVARPDRIGHIVLGAVAGAFPDLFYIPEALFGLKLDPAWWRRFHYKIQWYERPPGLAVDALWAFLILALIRQRL